MKGTCIGSYVIPIKNEDIFDGCNMAEYIPIINLCSSQLVLFFVFLLFCFFFKSQHGLCFMHNKTTKNGFVYRLSTLGVLSFHRKPI